MSTHNICFRREIRKILCGYSLLSVAMLSGAMSCNKYLSLSVLLLRGMNKFLRS